MHARELIELGALAALHGPAFCAVSRQTPTAALSRYWSAARRRLDRWGWALKAFSDEAARAAPGAEKQAAWNRARPVIEEIFAAEPLGRVWTAVAAAHDRALGVDELAPVAENVLAGHDDARHRALSALVYGEGFELREAVEVNHLRRNLERWTDYLLALLDGLAPVTRWAFDAKRCRGFARLGHSRRGAQCARQLTLVGLRACFERRLNAPSPNGDLNAEVASAVLSCFDASLFDSTGLARSLWEIRLALTTADTQGWIEELLGDEAGQAPPTWRATR